MSTESRSADPLRTNNAVVHVRGDSETELDLLFSVLNNNEPKLSGQTYRNKNLPLSFFQPPEPRPNGSHSREVSLDYGPTGNQAEAVGTVYHSRSHSSPAKLPVSLSLAPAGSSFDHLKDGFIDVLPAVTSSRFFSNNSSSAWNSVPSKLQETSMISTQNNQSAAQLANGTGGIGRLPMGWEEAMTPEGEIYFIDHINKKTSWYDPRLPKELQKAAVTKALSQHRAHKHQQQIPLAQQPGAVVQQPGSIAAQKQQQQQQGRLVTNTSSPLVPVGNLLAGASKQNQMLQHQCLQSSMSTSHQLMSGAGQQSLSNIPLNEQLIRQKLLKVQENKERLSRLQEECFREEQRLLTELCNHTQGTVLSSTSADRALSELMPGNNNLAQRPDHHHHQQQQQQHLQQQQQQSEYVLNDLTSSLDLDGTAPAQMTSDSIPMDSDELVSSLTDDFGRDLLSMDIQMMDILL